MKKILATFVLFSVFSFSIASAAGGSSEETRYYLNDEADYEMYLPASWLDQFEAELIDFTYKGAQESGGKRFDSHTKDLLFQMESMTSDFYHFFHPLEENLFSVKAPKYEELSDLCDKPGVIRTDIQPWNTAGTQFWACHPQMVGDQSSFVVYEFQTYPEASGYGLHALSYVKLLDSPYAGVRFNLKMKQISQKIVRLMPCECEDDAEKAQRMNKRAEKLAEKYMQKLASQKFKTLPSGDRKRLKSFFEGLKSFKEV